MTTATAPPKVDRPKLADELELIGEFEDSGFKKPQYIARRMDGQVIQLSHLLYMIAEQANGERDLEQIAERVSEESGRGVSSDNVSFLIDKSLRPLGVLAGADGTSPKLKRSDPLLALKFRAALVPERAVKGITTAFKPLFWPPVIIALLLALGAVDVYVFLVHGVAQSVRSITYNPVLLLMVFGLVALSAAFHECGHATACRYGGAKPGVMGAGIYIVWPAFYTDVTDAYRLNRAGRLRTDLGGVYFNVVFALLTFGAYLITGFEPLLVVVLIQHMQAIYQFMPFLRLDGYYIISDLTGVPDMFARIRPVLRSLIPGREPEAAVKELKPWVRVATTVYICTLIPALLLIFGMLAFSAPRMFATAWDSFFVQTDKLKDAFSDGRILVALGSIVQIAALTLPAIGLVLTTSRMFKRMGTLAWTKSEGKPVLRGGYAVATAAVVGLVAFVWWPNGDYRPIQPGEKGTLASGVRSLAEVPTGRPALTEERAEELNGAPGESERFNDAVKATEQRRQDAAERRQERERQERARERREEQAAPEESAPEDGTQTPSEEPQNTTPAAPPPEEQPAPVEPAPAPEPAPEQPPANPTP